MGKNEKKSISLDEQVSAQRALEKVLSYAVVQEAESVLLNLVKGGAEVHYRLLGKWRKVLDVSDSLAENISQLIKEKASIDDRKDAYPGSGSFKFGFEGFKMIFQISINPIDRGEKIFLDVYKESSRLFKLSQLGMQKSALNKVQKCLKRRSGISMVLGNFNSGRTATLYSLMQYLNRPELNIVSIEHNIEFDLPDINQSRLDPRAGFDYSYALNSLLKQDPDVIMVADISDHETASGVIRAAERGYPILSGLYSRDIYAALSFLRDMEVPLKQFIENCNMIINQRVLSKVCPHCISKDRSASTKIKELAKKIDCKNLLNSLKESNIIPKKNKIEEHVFYKGKGCPRCNGKGETGTIGVFEILEIDAEVKKLAEQGHLYKIKEEIKRQGGLYIKEDALIKAILGIVTIDEVIKVADQK